jgi:DNA-binding MarR family transcriptional regulator
VTSEATSVSAAERLSFLLARHGGITNVRIRTALEAAGLSPRQSLVLTHLSIARQASQQALIELLDVDPSVLVTILNDLERDGLIARRRDPSDRRRHIVEITAAGDAATIRAQDALAAVDRHLFADLDKDEVAHLQQLLSRVRTSPDDPACTES